MAFLVGWIIGGTIISIIGSLLTLLLYVIGSVVCVAWMILKEFVIPVSKLIWNELSPYICPLFWKGWEAFWDGVNWFFDIIELGVKKLAVAAYKQCMRLL